MVRLCCDGQTREREGDHGQNHRLCQPEGRRGENHQLREFGLLPPGCGGQGAGLRPVESAIVHTKYSDVLPANKALAGASVEMIPMERREYLLKEALAKVASQYDFILIDCPPSLELLTLNCLCAADTVLVPVQCEYYALEGLSDLLSTIRIVKGRLNPGIDLEGLLLTMYDGRTNLSLQVAEEVKRHFPGKVFATVIPRNVRLSEAPSHGKPVNAYDGSSRGSVAYQRLTEELLEHNPLPGKEG